MTERTRGEYTLSWDPARVDLAVVHGFLRQTYWAEGIPMEVVARSVAGSIPFSVHHATDGQVAFARVITDRTTFGYLADVFVLDSHRGKGLADWMMEAVDAHPELQQLRRWMLVTRDAHGLYERHGWTPVARPERIMERTLHTPYLAPEPAPAG